MYGHTDLADFYRDCLTLRQVWVRLTALPYEAPIWRVIEAEEKRAEAEQKERDVLATLAQFQPPRR